MGLQIAVGTAAVTGLSLSAVKDYQNNNKAKALIKLCAALAAVWSAVYMSSGQNAVAEYKIAPRLPITGTLGQVCMDLLTKSDLHVLEGYAYTKEPAPLHRIGPLDPHDILGGSTRVSDDGKKLLGCLASLSNDAGTRISAASNLPDSYIWRVFTSNNADAGDTYIILNNEGRFSNG